MSEHRDEKSRLAVPSPRLDHKTGRKIRNSVRFVPQQSVTRDATNTCWKQELDV